MSEYMSAKSVLFLVLIIYCRLNLNYASAFNASIFCGGLTCSLFYLWWAAAGLNQSECRQMNTGTYSVAAIGL